MVEEWFYDQMGEAQFYLDEDKFISKSGKEIATLERDKVVSVAGETLGIFENGAIYDTDGRLMAIISTGRGYVPTTNEIYGGDPDNSEFIPTDQDLTEEPGDPGISGIPYKPVHGDWSDTPLEEFFGTGL
ncbi:MAG: hypothetical protein HF314_03825 [Ignavibacteria bacterium]|jgi:hypothetical protein|nr:hypothetical protein [Ignavibacteria bacterium]MCU7502180.1 hypothetical protein [Ignavibacteria bacterium]MCU7517397.1 hypothetical protein [Ignavibacteria bacterium]